MNEDSINVQSGQGSYRRALTMHFTEDRTRISHVIPASLELAQFDSVDAAKQAILEASEALLNSIRVIARSYFEGAETLAEILKQEYWIYGGAATSGDWAAKNIFHAKLPYAKDGWRMSFSRDAITLRSPSVRGYDTNSFSTAIKLELSIGSPEEVPTLEDLYAYTKNNPIIWAAP